MPIYDYQCKHCKETITDVIAHVNEEVPCPDCEKPMTRLMPATHGINMGVGAYGRYDETLGKYLPTNKARREEMAKQGVTEKGCTPKVQGDAWV
ncbi:MAG: FmdB family zinc ribbon protein [Candidatus Thorarchaeota archaeon]|jgi:putative FmdB family regulatory protein